MKDNTVVVLGAPASWVRLSVVFSTRTVTTPKYWIVVPAALGMSTTKWM